MGQAASCESDEVSCSSAFATCRTRHCASSCMKKAQQVEVALAPIEEIAQGAIKTYIEENLSLLLQKYLPAALAAHFSSAADSMIDAAVVPSITVASITTVATVSPNAVVPVPTV